LKGPYQRRSTGKYYICDPLGLPYPFGQQAYGHPVVEALKEHTINFTGLKDGQHEFHFELDKEFFDMVKDEDIEGGHVAVYITLDKNPNLLVVNIQEDGKVDLRCARCNGPLNFPVQCDQRQIFRLANDEESDDLELVVLDPSAHSVNLTHYIYECLRLSLPIRPVHPINECDPEVVKVLKGQSKENEQAPDPRWDALKELKNKRP
jgi:uncharacterized metal-binding protein YceD (DUF177 family)